MDRELRNWYLNTMGIVQYLPRSEEPVELPLYAFSEDSHKPEAQDAVPVKEAVDTNTGVARVLAMVGQPEAVSNTPEIHLPNTSSAETTLEHDDPTTEIDHPVSMPEQVSFRLACWQPCDDLLVFNQFPPGVPPEAVQIQLLNNMLRAIGRLSGPLESPEMIDWPMAHVADASASAARSMLSVFLDARIKKRGVLWILLLGDTATELLSPSGSEKDYDGLIGSVEEVAGGAKTIVARSLQEMLAQPETKAETWQAIKHLAAHS